MEKLKNFQEIQSKINIVDVIQKYVSLQKKGSSWVGICPFHDDTNPSLFVSEKLQLFNCFVCGTKGNAFNFVKKIKNISYQEAMKEVCSDLGIEIDQNLLLNFEKSAKLNQKLLPYWDACKLIMQAYFAELERIIFEKKNLQVINFLQSRQITSQVISAFKIGFAPAEFNFLNRKIINNAIDEIEKAKLQKVLVELGYINEKNHDFFYNRIIFPIFDENENVVGFSGRSIDKNVDNKYLNSKESLIFQKNNILFHLGECKRINPKKIYLTEGFMEVISLWKIDIKNSVAIMGTNFSKQHVGLLRQLNNLSEIVICLDYDLPGQEASVNVAQRLLSYPQWQISLLTTPKSGFKDLDELIANTKRAEIIQYLQTPINYFLWYTLHLLEKTKISDPILKKAAIANSVLKEIKKFANLSITNVLIKQLADVLQVNYNDLLNEFGQLRIIRKQLKLIRQTDLFAQIITEVFNCKLSDYEVIKCAKKCFQLESKLITLFFNNFAIIEFAEKVKCNFVFQNIQNIYQKIWNNAFHKVVWDEKDFLHAVQQNDFSFNLLFDNVKKMLISESQYITTLCSDDSENKTKLIDELVKQAELNTLDLEISLDIARSCQLPQEKRSENEKKIVKLIKTKQLLINKNK